MLASLISLSLSLSSEGKCFKVTTHRRGGCQGASMVTSQFIPLVSLVKYGENEEPKTSTHMCVCVCVCVCEVGGKCLLVYEMSKPRSLSPALPTALLVYSWELQFSRRGYMLFFYFYFLLLFFVMCLSCSLWGNSVYIL